MNFDDFKKELLEDTDFKKEYYKKDLSFDVGQMLLEARAIKGFSQKELAELADTKQPSIARVENGALPSLRFLNKLAKAMGTYLIPPRFGFMKYAPNEVYDNVVHAQNETFNANFKLKDFLDTDEISSTSTHNATLIKSVTYA